MPRRQADKNHFIRDHVKEHCLIMAESKQLLAALALRVVLPFSRKQMSVANLRECNICFARVSKQLHRKCGLNVEKKKHTHTPCTTH